MTEPKSVVIIGGGSGGMLVAANLLHNAAVLEINLINPRNVFGRGVAYHPHSDSHLLNVTAGSMSVFPGEPNHFVNWLINQELFPGTAIEIIEKAYLPRRIYGEYLLWVWENAKHDKADSVSINEIVNRAINIEQSREKYIVHLQDGKSIVADYVVLATGNAAPRNPSISNLPFYHSKEYFNNPWSSDYLHHLDHEKDILIIGNGLTMVDVVQSVVEEDFKGIVHSISPHGFGILAHHNEAAYDGLLHELKEKMSLLELVTLLNRHIKKLLKHGMSAEPIIDSLRSRTQSIWMSLTLDEKKKFMARVRHLWGVARHRLPIQVYDSIQHLKAEGKLKIWSGNICNMVEDHNGITVEFFDKKSKTVKLLNVGRVINCTGPEVDLERMNDPLMQNLIHSGIIVPHKLKLGLEAEVNSLQVMGSNDRPQKFLFAIGGLLRGMLWESTAIPEIRTQAKLISDQVIADVTSSQ